MFAKIIQVTVETMAKIAGLPLSQVHSVSGNDEPPLSSYLVLEDRTDDLAAIAANEERMWMRSDLSTPTVKGVIKYNNGTYAVKTFTIS